MSLFGKVFSNALAGVVGKGDFSNSFNRTLGGFFDGFFGTNLVGDYDSKKNYDLQKANLKYQKELQKQIFEREDTAVQRRVKDLLDAGQNPLLAAGTAAQSGAVVSTTAPQRVTQKYNPLEKIALLTGVDKTLAETAVLGATKENLETQNSNLIAQNDLLKAQTIKAIADATGWTTEEVAFKFFGYKSTSTTKRPAYDKSDREKFFDELHSGKTPFEIWRNSASR